MDESTLRLVRRQVGIRPKSVLVRPHRRTRPRPKTWQQRLAEYRQAQRRLQRAVLQPIRPPRITRRRNGLRSVRLAWEGSGSGARGGAAWAAQSNSAILHT